MTHPAPHSPPTASTRRAGYLIAVLINAVVLYAANIWPGWAVIGFLNSETALVLGLVNASLIVTIAANVCYLAADPPWLKALGGLLTSAVGLLALVRIWRVFPFDFDSGSIDWTLITRILLVLSIVGSAIGILSGAVGLIKSVVAATSVAASRSPAAIK